MVQQVAETRGVDEVVASERLEFEEEFRRLVDRVAEEFPDQYAGSSVAKDFAEPSGTIYVNDQVRDDIEGLAGILSESVSVQKSRLSKEQQSEVLDTVDERLDWISDEIEVVSAYRVSGDTLIVDLYGTGSADWTNQDLEKAKRDLADLAETVEIDTHADPFPLE